MKVREKNKLKKFIPELKWDEWSPVKPRLFPCIAASIGKSCKFRSIFFLKCKLQVLCVQKVYIVYHEKRLLGHTVYFLEISAPVDGNTICARSLDPLYKMGQNFLDI